MKVIDGGYHGSGCLFLMGRVLTTKYLKVQTRDGPARFFMMSLNPILPSLALTNFPWTKAGAAAAFAVDVLVYPLDTIKTRYQSQDFLPKSAKPPIPRPLAQRGLYQGIGGVMLATLPAAGVFFTTYESAKGAFGRHLPIPEPMTHSCASAVAEMASCLVLTPAEVIKQNAQMIRAEAAGKGARKSTSLMAYRRLVGTGISGGLFSGYSALVARNLPFTALQFPMFEYARARMWDERRRRHLGEDEARGVAETGLIAGSSAAMAGALAAFLTTPSDVVKTRMMVRADDGNAKGEAQKDGRGPGKVAGDIWRSGLYLGMYAAAKRWLEGEGD
ncbi:hypothetical protein Trco_007782 [Trichoderma cornu-damae]|uniref:Mitochondrial carrier n=1 Tax=Trichoderma cornu-damae TaxID=654480 RepID=A0A9P8QGC3_9HYPO|nr:hypothetical protein Trco_007782 [Trichoderma cornu-damae]